MSVLLEFAMFPTDKGESVSEQVSQIIKLIDQSGFDYQLTPMGTIVETATFEEATGVMNSCYALLEPQCNRVYCTATFDVRKGEAKRKEQKIVSVEKRIGVVQK
jgi:uncharacterized protein (TIGR00106 family)